MDGKVASLLAHRAKQPAIHEPETNPDKIAEAERRFLGSLETQLVMLGISDESIKLIMDWAGRGLQQLLDALEACNNELCQVAAGDIHLVRRPPLKAV